jgi:SAM-dependent methyltransferase
MQPPASSKTTVVERARASKGASSDAVYRMVAAIIERRHPGGGTLLDVGCGGGTLRDRVSSHIDRYFGADVVRYDSFPEDAEFVAVDLDSGRIPLPDRFADIVVAVETIEHLENPRSFFRELCRLAKQNALLVVTTPNQLSLLSLLTLLAKGRFNAFQDRPGLYPAHITALLEIDLIRVATECGLTQTEVTYSGSGRIPGLSLRWPQIPLFRGRLFSDNIALSAYAT